MKLKRYMKEDQSGVKKFVLSVLENEFGFPRKPEWDYNLEDPDKYYKNKGGIFYILKEKEKIIGTIAAKKLNPDTVEIKRLYLSIEYRGKGHGEKLIDEILRFCKEKGFKKIILDTWGRFTVAKKLYQKKGFIITRTEGEQIFMEKYL